MEKLPTARTASIVTQNLGQEILVYALDTHKALSLNETASVVYQACDGIMSFEELKGKHKLTEEIIFLALDELKAHNLLAEDAAYASPFAGMSRREVIRKVGLGSMIVLPVIYSLVAPTSAHASSGGNFLNGTPCTDNSQCKTGSVCRSTIVSSINATTGGNLSSPGTPECCLTGGPGLTNFTTGTYTRGSATSGNCNFAGFCCTGSGTEFLNPVNNKYDCTCDATS